MPSLRLFIALETPADIRRAMGDILTSLRETDADVKWEPIDKLHATLKFLGDTDDTLLPDVVYSLEKCCTTSPVLSLLYAGLGCFPNVPAPRVVWVGMKDLMTSLVSLQQCIEGALEPLGFAREDRPFHPHVTLGRVKSQKNSGSLLRRMESLTFESQPVEIRDVALVKSELRPGGSVYTTLKRIPLTGAAGTQRPSRG
jgi:RNA 2',3'-cyclic 3'-phosphodiesterase